MRIKVKFRIIDLQNGQVKLIPIADETIVPRPAGSLERANLYAEFNTGSLKVETYAEEPTKK
jgi:hypothetical protein